MPDRHRVPVARLMMKSGNLSPLPVCCRQEKPHSAGGSGPCTPAPGDRGGSGEPLIHLMWSIGQGLLRERGLQITLQIRALFHRYLPRSVVFPVTIGLGPHRLRIIVRVVVEHQIDAQGLVELVRLGDESPDLVFEA